MSKFTLKSEQRIKSLFKKGKRFSKSPLSVVFLKNGTVVNHYLYCADRSANTAVKRNRIKRILRALVSELKLPDIGYDIAFIASFNFNTLSYMERKQLVLFLFKKIEDESYFSATNKVI